MTEATDSTTKKKAPVTADQFDDADEEEEIAFAAAAKSAEAAANINSSPKKRTTTSTTAATTTTEEKTSATNTTKVIPAPTLAPVVTAPVAPAADTPKAAMAATALTLGGARPDPPNFPRAAATTSRSLPLLAPSTIAALPTPAKRVAVAAAPAPTNPLDALALACGAEAELRGTSASSSVTSASPAPPVAGSRYTAQNGRAYPVPADEICCTDVLCGRGGQSNHHPGNIFFRRLVRAKQEEYLKANKREKTVVARDIVKLTRMLTPPGRFLRKDPKDENYYVDVGDIQARNKASQALREGAPELREELRDQHRGGPEVKLPYQGNRPPPSGADASNEGSDDDVRVLGDQEEMAARAAAAARGLFYPGYGRAATATRLAKMGGRRDPPETAGVDEDAPTGPQAAMQAAAEERARRFMMHAAGAGGGQHMMNPHFGMGRSGGMNPFLAGSPAAQLQAAAAFQAAAAGGGHFLSPQAMMMAGGQQSAAALLQASRARELNNHFDAANFAAAAAGGMNPMLLAGQQRAHGQLPFQDSMRYHDLVGAGGNKRDREGIEREIDENYAKAAKINRQYL